MKVQGLEKMMKKAETRAFNQLMKECIQENLRNEVINAARKVVRENKKFVEEMVREAFEKEAPELVKRLVAEATKGVGVYLR